MQRSPSSYETLLSCSTCIKPDKTTPQKSMNFSFHLCRELTEKCKGDPLKTAAANCITAKEFTISFYTICLPIAYQEKVYSTVSSSRSENTGHLRASRLSFPPLHCHTLAVATFLLSFYKSRSLSFYYRTIAALTAQEISFLLLLNTQNTFPTFFFVNVIFKIKE